MVTSMTLANHRKLFKFLENEYNPYIRPVSNQSVPVIVDIKLTLYSILSYDEKTGTLSSLINMKLDWQDEFISSGNFTMLESDRIPLPSSLVWSPRIYLFNTATEDLVLRTGETKFQTIFLDFNSRMHHTVIGLAVTKCDANSFYYPRDEHKCELMFAGDESQDKIMLKNAPAKNGDDTTVISPDGNWDVSEVSQIMPHLYSRLLLTLSFKISRNSLYPIVNLVIPLACLCMLNSFVFALPESSGERISYSLTMLLALILYLNILADRLPSTGPISLININIVVQFTTSCFVVVLSILSLRMHENEQRNKPVPKSWKLLYRIIHSPFCTKHQRNTRVNPKASKENPIATTIEEFEEECPPREIVIIEDVSWRELSRYTNKLFFGTAVLLYFVQAVIFFLYIFRVI